MGKVQIIFSIFSVLVPSVRVSKDFFCPRERPRACGPGGQPARNCRQSTLQLAKLPAEPVFAGPPFFRTFQHLNILRSRYSPAHRFFERFLSFLFSHSMIIHPRLRDGTSSL